MLRREKVACCSIVTFVPFLAHVCMYVVRTSLITRSLGRTRAQTQNLFEQSNPHRWWGRGVNRFYLLLRAFFRGLGRGRPSERRSEGPPRGPGGRDSLQEIGGEKKEKRDMGGRAWVRCSRRRTVVWSTDLRLTTPAPALPGQSSKRARAGGGDARKKEVV